MGTEADGRTIKTVEVASVRIRTVAVPIVLAVHLFFDISIFVITANQDVAIVAVVRYDLIQVTVRSFQNGQLRVATRQPHRGDGQDGEHGNAAHHPCRERSGGVSFRIGQHVGVPS